MSEMPEPPSEPVEPVEHVGGCPHSEQYGRVRIVGEVVLRCARCHAPVEWVNEKEER